ncbi:MAG TPA: hypothetical protein VMY76_16585 [Gemmatimonadales bacterium]|nr:hypothetical protein [Gemmatimonadales bacterium]
MRRDWVWAAMIVGLGACQPATSRPPYPPVPQAASTEVRLPPREATRLLAEALQADSIPPARVDLRDAWLETGWFDRSSGQRARHRPIGADVVRVRAWADPTRPGNSKLIVETLYRPTTDPSRPERELDRQVPRDHPVAIKVRAALQELVKRYGGPPAPLSVPATEPGEPDVEGPTTDSETLQPPDE